MPTRILLLALCLQLSEAGATVVVARQVEELAARVPLVVRARAGASESRWDAEHRSIHTWTPMQVSEVLKGRAPSLLVVRQAGGEVGRVGQEVSGEVRFREGEEILLFLDHPGDDAQAWVVAGMALGKVSFVTAVDGKLHAVRDARGLGLYDVHAQVVRRPGGPEDLGPVEPFLERMRAAVKVRAPAVEP